MYSSLNLFQMQLVEFKSAFLTHLNRMQEFVIISVVFEIWLKLNVMSSIYVKLKYTWM